MIGTCGYCNHETYRCSCVQRDWPAEIVQVAPADRTREGLLWWLIAACAVTLSLMLLWSHPVQSRPGSLLLEDAVPHENVAAVWGRA